MTHNAGGFESKSKVTGTPKNIIIIELVIRLERICVSASQITISHLRNTTAAVVCCVGSLIMLQHIRSLTNQSIRYFISIQIVSGLSRCHLSYV